MCNYRTIRTITVALRDADHYLGQADNSPLKSAVEALLTAVRELAPFDTNYDDNDPPYIPDEDWHVYLFNEERIFQESTARREALQRSLAATRTAMIKAGKIK